MCELQFNIDEMLKIKEGAGHKQYERTRKVNDDLINAAMKCRFRFTFLDVMDRSVVGALKLKADPNASRDMYGLTPLHYASHHGSIDMVKALLSHDLL